MTFGEILQQAFFPYPELVRFHARTRPRHPALIQDERRLDYAALDALMDRVAASLQRDGVRPGEAIAICAGASIEYAAVFLGALRAGVAVAPLSPSSTPESLAAMAGDADAKVFFKDKELQNLEAWLMPPGAKPEAVEIRPEWPFNIIYSSGTTGTPKGIVQPHGMRWVHVRRGVRNEFGPEA